MELESDGLGAELARVWNIQVKLKDKEILRGFDLTIREGETVALLGPNGSGKTILLQVLMGLLRPSHGNISLFGQECRIPYPREVLRKLGAVFETPGLFDSLSLLDNLRFFARIYDVQDSEGAINSLLERTELWDSRFERVERLSRGMRQRAAIVRCLLHRPRLILLDEPTTGLDSAGLNQTAEFLREAVVSSNAGALAAAPRISLLTGLADRAVVLHRGEILHSGPFGEVVHWARSQCLQGSSELTTVVRKILSDHD